jgi:nitrite reductase (NADH) small subunit
MSNWKLICKLDDIPQLGSRIVRRASGGDIAIFRNSADEVFALHDKCPHKGGPLSQGIVAGKVVTCPMHSWKIQLESGEAVAPDVGCAKSFAVKLEDGEVWLKLG